MKKEDIIIEMNEESISKISKLYYDYELDLKHVAFKKFTIKSDLGKKDDVEKSLDNSIEKYKHILSGLSKKEIDRVIKSFKKEMISGMYISVQITDTTVKIRSQIADFDLIFKDYIVSPGELPNNIFELQFVNMSDMRALKINEDEKLMLGIWTIITQVVGTLIYLQIPNKVNNTKKTSKLQVVGSKSKKKAKQQKKTYLYKTTYHIDDMDIDNEIAKTRSYNRKTSEWVSRGHWRTLPNGRKIWVKESIKRSKTNITNATNNDTSKNYKITRVDA